MPAHDVVAFSSLTERVGDAERDTLMTELNGYHAHGRLSAEELDRRQGLALTAVTRYDLLLLVSDLPGSDRALRDPSERRHQARRREVRRAVVRRGAAAAVLATPVVGTGWAVGLATQYSSGVETGFWATVIGGAIGYGTHTVQTWVGRRGAR